MYEEQQSFDHPTKNIILLYNIVRMQLTYSVPSIRSVGEIVPVGLLNIHHYLSHFEGYSGEKSLFKMIVLGTCSTPMQERKEEALYN